MDLVTYIRVIRRWLWLIVIVAAITGGAAFVLAKMQVPVYNAAITIQVGSAQYTQNPATDQLLTSQQLADTYAVIVKTYPVLEATVNTLKLNMKPSDLSKTFSVSIVPGTSLLKISVTYTDPDMTAKIANQLGAALIANSPISSMSVQEERETFLTDEVNKTREQLDKSRQDLADLDASIAQAKIDGSDTSQLLVNRNDIMTQINEGQNNVAQLTNTLAYLQKEGSSNSLQVVEQARVPTSSSNASSLVGTLLAAMIGAAITTGIFVVREFLSDGIRNPAELNTRFGLNILGTIAPFSRKMARHGLIMWDQPRSIIAESYRVLRDNLIYIERENIRHPRIYIVTSANPSEGKSVTAANLAVAFAITGGRVLLVDANLHNPTQHILFGLENKIGLSDVMTYNSSMTVPLDIDNNGNFEMYSEATTNVLPMTAALVSKTKIPDLDVITVGHLSAMPAESFGIPRIQELIYKIASNGNYETVIFDSSPLLSFSDSTVIASVTRGLVIMVIEPGQTRQGSVVRAVQQLSALSIPLAGVVLNRFHSRELDASYGMYSYGRYEPAGAGEHVITEPTPAALPDTATPEPVAKQP